MMPIKTDREYRALLQPLSTQSKEKRIETDYYIEGYATTFDTPYVIWEWDGVQYKEVIDRNALNGADFSDVIFQYDHQGMVFARNTNKTLIVEPNTTGLFVAGDLGKTNASKDIYDGISAGLITKMSWAFTVSEESYNKDTKTRTILKVKKVYDVSAVSYPANPDTEISARSFINGVIEREKQELLALQKRLELAKKKYEFLGGKKIES